MTTATQLSERPAIQYPDDDGEPMADNTLQFKWIVLIKEGLEHLFQDDPNVFVAGNLLWYPVEGEPTIRSAPDAMAAFGRPKGRRGSYKQWEEGNIAPQVVFEVLSPGNRPLEMAAKLKFYEKYGVEEYYIYDPDEGTVRGWLRVGDRLEEVSDMTGFVSPRLGIRFEPGEGADNLEIVGPDGELFRTLAQEIDRRKAAEDQAEAERRRARTADERARTADERARTADERTRTADERTRTADERAGRYAAKLRELGIEPD